MENIWYILCHSEYFTAICFTLWPFGNLVVILYMTPRFGVVYQEKSGNPCVEQLLPRK
jgi:hypothetical protein